MSNEYTTLMRNPIIKRLKRLDKLKHILEKFCPITAYICEMLMIPTVILAIVFKLSSTDSLYKILYYAAISFLFSRVFFEITKDLLIEHIEKIMTNLIESIIIEEIYYLEESFPVYYGGVLTNHSSYFNFNITLLGFCSDFSELIEAIKAHLFKVFEEINLIEDTINISFD